MFAIAFVFHNSILGWITQPLNDALVQVGKIVDSREKGTWKVSHPGATDQNTTPHARDSGTLLADHAQSAETLQGSLKEAATVTENPRLKELLIDAVRLRLRADVPVGAYLSGGLDSSVITAAIRYFTDNPLKTFSVTFEDQIYDESREQQELVQRLETDHHTVHCTYGTIAQAFPQVIWHTEYPIVRTAPTPLYLLSGLVNAQGYKVVLTGEGSDEILGCMTSSRRRRSGGL
jgi:asparagine synthetase B (glutamine-hydrolysing)